jgi:uncharacterized protein (TIGR02677 family)
MLQGTALFADIVHFLRELEQLSQEPALDPARVHRNLIAQKARFADLRATAYALTGRLERSSGAPAAEIRSLVDYAERFTGELVMAADRVGEAVRAIEQTGIERFFQAAAEHVVRDGLDATPQTLAGVCARWRSHWKLFCEWFLSQPGRLSNAELLRERIRAAIPALIRVITSINDRQLYRIDRSNDFRVLARWFARAESDAEAHQLWRVLFGLCPARHLTVNETTLDDYEASNVQANTSWMDAPPLRVSIRIRDGGSKWEPAFTRIVDRTAEKEKLVAVTREESLRILGAQTRLATGSRVRLSDLESLQMSEFELFLDLLAEALSARVFPTEPVEIVSGDGCLKVRLEPTGDGREALVVTPEGLFSGPDHWITVEQISTEQVLRC